MNTFSSLDAATVGIVLAPLIGFLINGLMGKKLSKSLIGMVGSGSVLVSFVLSCFLFVTQLSGSYESHTTTLFSWLPLGNYTVNFSFLVDPLSLLMLMVVTGVGFLIHVYSIGYMHNDEGFYKFFAYLNLFIFSMLLLVLGANFLVMFAGWEGVGLCSYLLIGFWYKNTDYTAAAQKAFVMNRIGDLGFLLGIFLILNTFGTLDFADVMNNASSLSANNPTLVAITLLLFVGATGKSAQVPLFTWLPDAMAGPTPVSALIHAATMVTAGIYMIARSNILYSLSEVTMTVVAITGLLTAVLAATIALKQNDIKKVLAYSTVSQLGYMVLAMGLGAYTAGVFHVMTHAFFKALLFLGAGSVIHAMGGVQDIRQMGGLSGKIKITFITFLIACIAIAGIPPFSGFFSKDAILLAAWQKSPVIYVIALMGALLTAFYMFRLLFITFTGKFRGTEEQKHHLHESPSAMTIPLIILAILSAVGGLIGIPNVIMEGGDKLAAFLHPVIATHGEAHHVAASTEFMLMGLSTVLVILAIVAAWYMFKNYQYKEAKGLGKVLENKWYVDELYDTAVVSPLKKFGSFLKNVIEKSGIDGVVNGAGRLVQYGSRQLRLLQSGQTGNYILLMVLSIVIIFIIQFFLRK